MDRAGKPQPSEQQLARWRRDFEAARSFENSDDQKYWPFQPIEQTKLLRGAHANSKNALPRIAALQSWEFQGPTAPPPKHSLPQQYDPEKHGSWEPSDQILIAYASASRTSLMDFGTKSGTPRFGQFVEDARYQADCFLPTDTANRFFDAGEWDELSHQKKGQIREERTQLRQRALQQTHAGGSEAPENGVAHQRNESGGSGSVHSGSGELTIQQQLGAGARCLRNGLVWKATYGGNF